MSVVERTKMSQHTNQVIKPDNERGSRGGESLSASQQQLAVCVFVSIIYLSITYL